MSLDDPNSLSGDELAEIAELCELVGFCLYQFSRVEESLAALYGTAAGISNIETVFRSHDEIREFQYRLGMTDATVHSWIDHLADKDAAETLKKEWNTLHRIIKEDSQERNRVAHFSIMSEDNPNGTKTFFVCPYFQFYSHLSKYGRATEGFRIPDGIRKFDKKSMNAKLLRFEKTSDRIDRFVGGLIENGAQLPKFASRPADPKD